jgi:hypothetical protein
MPGSCRHRGSFLIKQAFATQPVANLSNVTHLRVSRLSGLEIEEHSLRAKLNLLEMKCK